MSGRRILLLLLAVVAAAASVLSFAALRDLALVCGFPANLAWLLPVVVDAGAAAGSLVWLGGAVSKAARRFARSLALALLGLSVAANALGHGLEAFDRLPVWWVVVIVSAVAPAVLGAVVHLAVLVGRPIPKTDDAELDEPFGYELTTRADEAGVLDDDCASTEWVDAAPAGVPDRAAELIAAGAGRRRLSRELDITEYEARRLLAEARVTTPAAADFRSAGSLLDGALS